MSGSPRASPGDRRSSSRYWLMDTGRELVRMPGSRSALGHQKDDAFAGPGHAVDGVGEESEREQHARRGQPDPAPARAPIAGGDDERDAGHDGDARERADLVRAVEGRVEP